MYKITEETRTLLAMSSMGLTTGEHTSTERKGLLLSLTNSFFGYIKPCEMIRSCLRGIGSGGCVVPLRQRSVNNYQFTFVVITCSVGELRYDVSAYYCVPTYPPTLFNLTCSVLCHGCISNYNSFHIICYCMHWCIAEMMCHLTAVPQQYHSYHTLCCWS